jgi:hypothetical protein
MSARPEPPRSAELPDELVQHVTDQPSEWLLYLRNLNTYLSEVEVAHQSLKIDNHHLRQETVKQSSIIEFQKFQYKEALEENNRLTRENERALCIASPAVPTPVSPPASARLAKTPVDLTKRTPALAPPATSEPSRISERLPDPKEFDGTRSDLERFTQQIHAKMITNRDRFPTAESRLTYVSGRLVGGAYKTLLPKVKYGIPQFIDYPDLLAYLERAYGDPNQTAHAKKQLFGLRQKNQEFSVFLAEFQRLALESKLSEDALPTLLEQALSRELQEMLLHSPAPSESYHDLAVHLQSLENRRLKFEASHRTTRSYATAAKPLSSPRATVVPVVPTVTSASPISDPMDLSSQQRYRPRSPQNGSPGGTRRERGECFRCGGSDHLVRDCPLPDNRPARPSQTASPRPGPASSPVLQQSQPTRPVHPALRSSSPTESQPSTNGMSLLPATGRL